MHALNILRALYRDTRLSEEVFPYISDGLKVAVLGYSSTQWMVSNVVADPLPSNRQHLSYDVCLEVRGEIIRTVLCCIVY